MKLKSLWLSMVFLTSCSKTILHPWFSSQEVNQSMMASVTKVCKQNGGIKSLEIKKDGNAYFFCKKQGFLEVNQLGEILTVKGKNPQTSEIKSVLVEECVKACGENDIKTIQPHNCECRDGKKVME